MSSKTSHYQKYIDRKMNTPRKRRLSRIHIIFAMFLITALLAGPGALRASRPPAAQPVSGTELAHHYSRVGFRQNRIMLYTGSSRKLKPLQKDAKKKMPAVRYRIADSSVASVDRHGVLHGKKEGQTRLVCHTARNQKITLTVLVRKKPAKKVIYLTFDDGPGAKNTPKLLKLLKQYDAKATFFIIGKQAKEHPEIVRREYREGHTVAIHTYTHNYRQIYRNTGAFFRDFDRTEHLLRKITGDTPRFNRMPGGSNNTIVSRQDSRRIQKKLRKRGYICMDWNAVTNDAVGVNYSVNTMVHYGITSIDAIRKDAPVVLIHDEDMKTKTVPVVRALLKHYTAKGYSFEPLDLYDGKPIQFVK